MRSRFFSLAAGASLTVGCVIAIVFCITTFSRPVSRSFHYQGVAWEIACREGALVLDNGPQRELELQQQADVDFHAQVLRNEARQNLIREIDQASYGEAYRAATEKLSAWDQAHARSWPVLKVAPTSADVAGRVHLLWLVLLFALLPVGWLIMRMRARDRGLGRMLSILGRTAFVVLYVALIGAWILSYRKPIIFFVYTADSAYSVKISRGSVAIGRPPVATGDQIAAIALLASRIRNSDITWTIGISPRDPRPRHGVRPRLLIWPDIARESSTQNLAGAGVQRDRTRLSAGVA